MQFLAPEARMVLVVSMKHRGTALLPSCERINHTSQADEDGAVDSDGWDSGQPHLILRLQAGLRYGSIQSPVGPRCRSAEKVRRQCWVYTAHLTSICRLEKRVLVPLPSPEAKVQMMRKHLEDRAVPDIPYDEVGRT